MYLRSALVVFAGSLAFAAQEQAPAPAPASPPPAAVPAQRAEPANPDEFVVTTGTRIPLSMINSVSTKTAVSRRARVSGKRVSRFW